MNFVFISILILILINKSDQQLTSNQEISLPWTDYAWIQPFTVNKGQSRTNISANCRHDLFYITKKMFAHEKPKWLIAFIDSIGKPPAGILRGQAAWTGSYEECSKIVVPTVHEMKLNFGGWKGKRSKLYEN